VVETDEVERKQDQSGLGQLMLYMLGAHVQRFKAVHSRSLPTPMLGVYMEELKLQTTIADLVHVEGGSYKATCWQRRVPRNLRMSRDCMHSCARCVKGKLQSIARHEEQLRAHKAATNTLL